MLFRIIGENNFPANSLNVSCQQLLYMKYLSELLGFQTLSIIWYSKI
jgi:hypothetical protein